MKNKFKPSYHLNNTSDNNSYIVNLITECDIKCIISKSRLMQIRNEIASEFVETAKQYTKRESSFIPEETAEQLMDSMLFRCDVYLRNLNSFNKAVQTISDYSIKEILSRSGKLAMFYLSECDFYINNVRKTCINTRLEDYNQSVWQEYDNFRKNYNYRFSPRDTGNILTYPLLYNIIEEGILYIRNYYRCLWLENKFCIEYGSKNIEGILRQYGKIYGCDYKNLVFNICSAVLEITDNISITDKEVLDYISPHIQGKKLHV